MYHVSARVYGGYVAKACTRLARAWQLGICVLCWTFQPRCQVLTVGSAFLCLHLSLHASRPACMHTKPPLRRRNGVLRSWCISHAGQLELSLSRRPVSLSPCACILILYNTTRRSVLVNRKAECLVASLMQLITQVSRRRVLLSLTIVCPRRLHRVECMSCCTVSLLMRRSSILHAISDISLDCSKGAGQHIKVSLQQQEFKAPQHLCSGQQKSACRQKVRSGLAASAATCCRHDQQLSLKAIVFQPRQQAAIQMTSNTAPASEFKAVASFPHLQRHIIFDLFAMIQHARHSTKAQPMSSYAVQCSGRQE